MKKPHKKLMASAFLTITAITLMVTVSYAWVTLSGSPALTGVQINIGGRNTIQIAPDIPIVQEEEILHYPGVFQDSFRVSEHTQYDYLKTFAGLKPVSTADGIHWFMPDADVEVQSDGTLGDYRMETDLSHANAQITTGESIVEGKTGSYAYLDFWVVSPLDCELRVSVGSPEEGSYLIGLPEVVENPAAAAGYGLSTESGEAAACARVGFLVNDDVIGENEAMALYADTEAYSGARKLKGYYQEPGTALPSDREYTFLIYEPNGTLHTGNGVSVVQSETGLSYMQGNDGDYIITQPIGYENGAAVLTDISDRLVVQKTSTWRLAENGDTVLSQLFETTVQNQNWQDLPAEELAAAFYQTAMQNQFSNYVVREQFFESTELLYGFGDGSVTEPQDQAFLQLSNAAREGVIVSLERDVPQRIRMYVWLEGQDADCVREAALEYFAIGIELAGSTE